MRCVRSVTAVAVTIAAMACVLGSTTAHASGVTLSPTWVAGGKWRKSVMVTADANVWEIDSSPVTSNWELEGEEIPKVTQVEVEKHSSAWDHPVPKVSEAVVEKQIPSPTISETISSSPKPKRVVLLFNLGGPETLDDVRGFLYNLFSDPDIIRLPSFLSPLQKPLAWFIAWRRYPKSQQAYASIGGGSPIVRYTREQASLLQSALAERGEDAKVYFAMRYWHPLTPDVLSEIKKNGVDELVLLPLYPQYSISTSGSSLKEIEDLFEADTAMWKDKVKHTVISHWYDRPEYIATLRDLIMEQIRSLPDVGKGPVPVNLMFSAHGVPESYVTEAGDPYKDQMEDCVRMVENAVAKDLPEGVELNVTLSFQSRVGPVKWLQPYTDKVIAQMGRDGVKNLVVVPISFVSEHVETLEEIDQEYRELAHESGITNWRRVPALNTEPRFINDLADLVIQSLQSPPQSAATTLREALLPTPFNAEARKPPSKQQNTSIFTRFFKRN